MPNKSNPATVGNAQESILVYVKNYNTNVIEKIATSTGLQVGLNNSPAELQVTGRTSLSAINVSLSAGQNYDISNNVTFVNISPTASGTVSVTLPSSPRQGQILFIKDYSGNASTTNIVVKSGNQSQLIDGSLTKTIFYNYGSLVLAWQGDNWIVNSTSESNANNLYTVTSYTGADTISLLTDIAALDSTSGGFTLSLNPSPSSGKSIIIKDVVGKTGTNNVIISGNGKTIDGSSIFLFNSNYNSIQLIYTGSEWSIV
jgi:hypothetical protein